MDDEDVNDIINKVKTSGNDDDQDIDVDVNVNTNKDDSIDNNVDNDGDEELDIEETLLEGVENSDDENIMNTINKYTPSLNKLKDLFGQESETYNNVIKALRNLDTQFVDKVLKDNGILNENNFVIKNKNLNFVSEIKNKLKENLDMIKLDNPIETPTKVPTKTPTKVPRRSKPFKTPIIKPGTDPKPKANI